MWKLFPILLLLASPLYAEPVPYGGETVSLRPLPQVRDTKPVNPSVRYVGGYEIVARGTSQVAGLSDLIVTPEGQVTALSDLGAMVRFPLSGGGVKIDLLRDSDGRTSINRDFNDAEDIAIAPDGTRYVSYERHTRIRVYRPGAAWSDTPADLALPGLSTLPFNEGLEGLAFVGGRLLAGAEIGGFWLCGTVTPGCAPVKGPPVPGFLYKLVSLAPVPGHASEVLALYRYFDPFTGPRSTLSLLRLAKNPDGSDRLVKVEDLATVKATLPADNYEGVAAVVTATGYRLYLISDNLTEADKPRLLVFDWTR